MVTGLLLGRQRSQSMIDHPDYTHFIGQTLCAQARYRTFACVIAAMNETSGSSDQEH